MKTPIQRQYQDLEGVDEKLPQGDKSATIIENMTVDERTGGWDSRVGWEKFFPSDALFGPFNNYERIHSLYCWSTHQGARQFYLYEHDSLVVAGKVRLRHTIGNPPSDVAIETKRVKPAKNQAATDYEPFGRHLVILNGYDTPAHWDGRDGFLAPLGWHNVPSPPEAWGVDYGHTGSVGGAQNFVAVDPDYQTPNWAIAWDHGLGFNDGGAINTYKWKVSLVNEIGSESPVSAASGALSWTTLTSGVYQERRQSVFLSSVPKGPDGTIARKIYRTRNLGEGEAADPSEVFYYVGTIRNNADNVFVDAVPDSRLGATAPTDAGSVIMPAPGARFAAAFKGCLFVDGGQADSSRLYHSNPGKMDTFSALDFFDTGSRDGGSITGMHPYYDNLLVFREKAIEVVQGEYGSFRLSPFFQGTGTKAIHTVTSIRGMGVFFLADDGVYRIYGSTIGGASLQVERISDSILKTIKRINPDLLARATAAYSAKWKEWHCYFPADGADLPNLGIVFHTEKKAWSTRIGFPVGALASDKDGNLVFGHNSGYTGAGTAVPTGVGNRLNGQDFHAGLFVITRRSANGHVVNFAGGEESTADAEAPTSLYRSAWRDFGHATQKKFIKYVYLYVMTTGDNTVPITYYMDFQTVGTASAGMKMQRSEHPDQPVFDTAVWDTDAWTEGLLTEIRYPIAQKGCSHFAFEVSTTNDFVLVGYSVELVSNKMRTGAGKTS